MELGSVYVENQRQYFDVHMPAGCKFRVHTHPRRFYFDQDDKKTLLVNEHSDFCIVDKPHGWPMHATVDNALENLIFELKNFQSQPLLITHRLDQPTRGLVFLAKNLHSQSLFNSLLKSGQVEKTYLALTEKALPLGPMRHFMQRSPKAPKTVSRKIGAADDLECRLSVVASEPYSEKYFLHKIQLETGRTHQIRAQLAFEGSPILGDKIYGSTHNFCFRESAVHHTDRIALGTDRIALCCSQLGFEWQGEALEYFISRQNFLHFV